MPAPRSPSRVIRALAVAALLVAVVVVLALVLLEAGERSEGVDARASVVDARAEGSGETAALRAPQDAGTPTETRGEPEGSESPPPAERVRTPASGPRGLVVEAGTGAPVEGVTVQMTFAGRVRAETTTGPDGTFVLPPPERSHRVVEVAAGRWRASPHRVRLDEASASGQRELRFEVEPLVAAPLRGRVLDRRTGEPLPDFSLVASGPQLTAGEGGDGGADGVDVRWTLPPKRIEQVTTDDDGRFVSDGAFEEGQLELLLLDHPERLQRLRVQHDQSDLRSHLHVVEGEREELELRVRVGPTYRLGVELPPGVELEDLEAAFALPETPKEQHQVLSESGAFPIPPLMGLSDPALLEQRTPVRDGTPPWVRFPRPVVPARSPSGEEPHELLVRTEDGLWSGSARVDSIEGVSGEVVSVSLQRSGVLEGTVRDAEGKPVPSAYVRLASTEPDPRGPRGLGVERDGEFAYRWLAPGAYELRVETQRYEPWQTEVTVEAGAVASVAPTLTPIAPLGAISGVLRTSSGERGRGASVVLKGIDHPGVEALRIPAFRDRGGERVAEFVFEDVPIGRYELTLKPFDNASWTPRELEVVAPAEGVEFSCRDDVPTFDLEVHAVDAETGEPLASTWALLRLGDPAEGVRLHHDWESAIPRYEGLPEGRALRWTVGAPGYRMARGTERDLPSAGSPRILDVALTRGWGLIYLVTTPDREPLEGVEMIVDGEVLGTTDAGGRVALEADRRPETVNFRRPGWRVTWTSTTPDKEHYGHRGEIPVYMSRAE